MSIWQMILAWLGYEKGHRQGVADEAARQAGVRQAADNQALHDRVAIDEQVQAEPANQAEQELREKWSRPD